MKRFVLAVAFFVATLPAVAQQIDQPVTLSAQEYNMIIGALIQRDQILATLVAKQREAQELARGRPAKVETPDKPAAP